jgi:DNA invertase Pin-like site-specific DNA recombinase
MARRTTAVNGNEAILYVRVSTADQVETGVSLDAQTERLLTYAKLNNLEVIGILREEAISGSIPLNERPEGAKLAELVATGQVKHVVSLKLDRLFRNSIDALTTTQTWDKKGVALHLTDMGGSSLSTNSAMGRMMFAMMSAYAEFERNLTAERTTQALAHKKANNQAYSPTPYGKDRDGERLTDNKQEQTVISKMRSLRDEGFSLRGIAEHLNSNGIASKQGKQWHASSVRYVINNAI